MAMKQDALDSGLIKLGKEIIGATATSENNGNVCAWASALRGITITISMQYL